MAWPPSSSSSLDDACLGAQARNLVGCGSKGELHPTGRARHCIRASDSSGAPLLSEALSVKLPDVAVAERLIDLEQRDGHLVAPKVTDQLRRQDHPVTSIIGQPGVPPTPLVRGVVG